jgi:hypothetical protein
VNNNIVPTPTSIGLPLVNVCTIDWDDKILNNLSNQVATSRLTVWLISLIVDEDEDSSAGIILGT